MHSMKIQILTTAPFLRLWVGCQFNSCRRFRLGKADNSLLPRNTPNKHPAKFQHPNIIISHVQATHHWLTDLRSLALIVAFLLRTQIHKPRHASMPALSNETSNVGADDRCYSFAWIERSWTFVDPYFSFDMSFSLPFSTFSEKMEKTHHRIPLLLALLYSVWRLQMTHEGLCFV